MATLVDSYSEINQNTSDTTNSSFRYWEGQSFTGDGSTLNNVQFFQHKVNSPTGNAVVYIYAHSGTFGTSSTPTGSPLAVSDNVDVSTFPSSFGLITYNFSGANKITLVNGTKYIALFYYPF